MALQKTTIQTTAPYYFQDGTPYSGARLTYRLSKDDVDSLTLSVVIAGDDEYVVFDANGLLPAGFGLWSNTRGTAGSKWIFSITMSGKVIAGPVEVTLGLTTIELTTLLSIPKFPN